ncbi:MAG: sel1 repeat family protein, partial [Deltaproteobacteria bacterium]|nr:sel1 repeat family protein [Deltaproteobacteria bacterium]
EQDYSEAAKWYHRAAEEEHAQAQAMLGSMYSKGQGVEQDYKEAVKWYRKAADGGIDYAREALRNLE